MFEDTCFVKNIHVYCNCCNKMKSKHIYVLYYLNYMYMSIL